MSEAGVTVAFKVHFEDTARGRRKLRLGDAPASAAPSGSVPRVSRLMALAIRFEGLVQSGEVRNYAELARLGRVTRARLTQIMALLNLAPDIQEELLFLVPVTTGCDSVLERGIRPVAAVVAWDEQRHRWYGARPAPPSSRQWASRSRRASCTPPSVFCCLRSSPRRP